jgi:hypothetical protein
VAQHLSDISLPARFSDCIRAAGGRLLLPMPTLRQMTVLDLARMKIAGYVPLPTGDFFVAGGARVFFIADQKNAILDR